MPKLQQKQQKTSNNGATNKGTKHSCPAKVTPTSRDKSKKVSSLPVIIYTYVFIQRLCTFTYVLHIRRYTCYTSCVCICSYVLLNFYKVDINISLLEVPKDLGIY
jgi:hypothetical protein